MADCPETSTDVDAALAAMDAGEAYPVVTNGDLVWKIRQLRVDLKKCNADKAALRQWRSDVAD